MSYYFDKPTWKVWFSLIFSWIVLIAAAFLISSCKARKTDKSIDKRSENIEQVSTVKDVSNTVNNEQRKEEEEVTVTRKENVVTGEVEVVVTKYYKPDSVTPPGSPKETRTERYSNSKKESSDSVKENKSSTINIVNEKTDSRDSVGSTKSDIDTSVKNKATESKDNTFEIVISILFVIGVIFVIIKIVRNAKN